MSLKYFNEQLWCGPNPVVIRFIRKQYGPVAIRDDHGGQGCIVVVSQGLQTHGGAERVRNAQLFRS